MRTRQYQAHNVRALTRKIFGVIPFNAVTFEEITAEQNRDCDSSKNVWFLCYEEFPIFKGNKNVIEASKSKHVIKNRGHDFLLLFILTSGS